MAARKMPFGLADRPMLPPSPCSACNGTLQTNNRPEVIHCPQILSSLLNGNPCLVKLTLPETHRVGQIFFSAPDYLAPGG